MIKQLFVLMLLIGCVYPENLHNLKTGSMPCFQNDDWLEMREVPFSQLKLGDVICYRPSERKLAALVPYMQFSPLAIRTYFIFEGNTNMVCHRIVWRDATSVVVKSDISKTPDPFMIEPNDYRGLVGNRRCY
jgi:hypothetical protein